MTLFLVFYTGVAQATTPFFWDSINVDLALQTNGDVLVTETQTYTFTADHTPQRYRYIPLDRVDAITDIAVSENNSPLPIETGIQNNQQWIRWSHELNAPESHTFEIQYRVVGASQRQNNRRLIHWRALFPDRAANIKNGRVTVHIPEAIVGENLSVTSAGVGVSDRQLDAHTFEFMANGPLKPQEFMDIKVEFPASALTIPTPQWQQRAPSITQHQRAPQVSRQSSNMAVLWIPLSMFMVIVLVVLVSLIPKQCPKCGQRTIHRTSQVRRHPTRRQEGSREIHESCSTCDYRDRYTQTMPRTTGTTATSATTGYSSGGYSGGGYGGSGGSGGGGGYSGGGGGG